MSTRWRWRVAAASVLALGLWGCSGTAKTPGLVSIWDRKPSLPLLGKSEDQALREAVEKDPFPRAQGTLVASKPGTSAVK